MIMIKVEIFNPNDEAREFTVVPTVEPIPEKTSCMDFPTVVPATVSGVEVETDVARADV